MDKETVVHTYMDLCAAMKMNVFELKRYMNLEPIIQSQKNKYCILMHIYGI